MNTKTLMQMALPFFVTSPILGFAELPSMSSLHISGGGYKKSKLTKKQLKARAKAKSTKKKWR